MKHNFSFINDLVKFREDEILFDLYKRNELEFDPKIIKSSIEYCNLYAFKLFYKHFEKSVVLNCLIEKGEKKIDPNIEIQFISELFDYWKTIKDIKTTTVKSCHICTKVAINSDYCPECLDCYNRYQLFKKQFKKQFEHDKFVNEYYYHWECPCQNSSAGLGCYRDCKQPKPKDVVGYEYSSWFKFDLDFANFTDNPGLFSNKEIEKRMFYHSPKTEISFTI
jgi:hypothetical protein